MLKFISLGSGSSGNCYYLFTEKDGLINKNAKETFQKLRTAFGGCKPFANYS